MGNTVPQRYDDVDPVDDQLQVAGISAPVSSTTVSPGRSTSSSWVTQTTTRPTALLPLPAF
jgi:hypothetical protein